jgi:flagellar biosynthesis/type III secretory pathway chaperone
MNVDTNKIVELYRNLLHIVKKEQSEIAEQNLEGIERCCSRKMVLINELKILGNGKPWTSSPEMNAELEKLIKEIAKVNEANAGAVEEMKRGITREIASLHKGKTASKVYQSRT